MEWTIIDSPKQDDFTFNNNFKLMKRVPLKYSGNSHHGKFVKNEDEYSNGAKNDAQLLNAFFRKTFLFITVSIASVKMVRLSVIMVIMLLF